MSNLQNPQLSGPGNRRSMENPTSNGFRPAKVRRTDSYRGLSPVDAGGGSLTRDQTTTGTLELTARDRPPRSHGRGPTACEICRTRKTKCDNRRPTCGFCAKSGAICSYSDEESAFLHASTVPQLMNAIQHLTSLLEQQPAYRQFPPGSVSTPGISFSPNSFHASPQSEEPIHHHRYYDKTPRPVLDSPEGRPRDRKAPSPVGLNSVLKWKVFPQPCPHQIAIVDDDIDYPVSNCVPSTEISELLRLEAKYIAYVHTKNPTLDLTTLHNLILQVSEYGFDWSTRTCMVAMVCALGAYSERYVLDQNSSLSYNPIRPSLGSDTHIAYGYWNLAVKRLGSVIGKSSLEAVQCLCLAGIWYMYNMQPLQGWKHFALASDTWYTATIPRALLASVDYQDPREKSLAIEQSLYFTCFKSESELVFELSLPRSILEGFDYQHTFPSPPHLDRQVEVGQNNQPERRSWYYYLAEIACRHVINRIMHAQQDRRPDPTSRNVERMLEELEMFESQLNDWYISLPQSVSFPLPTGTIQPLEDELSQLLRARYLGIREMCYRPFVQLAINYNLNLPPDLLARMSVIVSQGLQYCFFRLQAVPPQSRHHGLWFQLPNSTTCALVLIAAERAQHDPNLHIFRQVQFPPGWHMQILATRDLLVRYWGDRRGGIWDCFRILEWALDGCAVAR